MRRGLLFAWILGALLFPHVHGVAQDPSQPPPQAKKKVKFALSGPAADEGRLNDVGRDLG